MTCWTALRICFPFGLFLRRFVSSLEDKHAWHDWGSFVTRERTTWGAEEEALFSAHAES